MYYFLKFLQLSLSYYLNLLSYGADKPRVIYHYCKNYSTCLPPSLQHCGNDLYCFNYKMANFNGNIYSPLLVFCSSRRDVNQHNPPDPSPPLYFTLRRRRVLPDHEPGSRKEQSETHSFSFISLGGQLPTGSTMSTNHSSTRTSPRVGRQWSSTIEWVCRNPGVQAAHRHKPHFCQYGRGLMVFHCDFILHFPNY